MKLPKLVGRDKTTGRNYIRCTIQHQVDIEVAALCIFNALESQYTDEDGIATYRRSEAWTLVREMILQHGTDDFGWDQVGDPDYVALAKEHAARLFPELVNKPVKRPWQKEHKWKKKRGKRQSTTRSTTGKTRGSKPST